MRTLLSVLLLSAVCCPLSAAMAADDFVPLFDGKTFKGWQGDMDVWKINDGVIVGSSEGKKLTHNTFLYTEKEYKNFILKIEFKLRNHNSGVQVRSKLLDDHIVTGYQADIAESRHMGILYEERGRGILVEVDPEKVAQHLKPGDWNRWVITCNGPRIKLDLNGYTTVDYTEKDAEKGRTQGIIALQLHQGPPMEVYFRNIEIKELP
jgi:hypothetical protein